MPDEAAPAPKRTRVSFSDSLIRLIVAVFIVPAPFEIVVGVVKRESYDFIRLGVIVGALLVLALMLAILRHRRVFVQTVIGYYLIAAGVGIAAFGVTVTLWAGSLWQTARWAPWVQTTLSALTPSVGLLLFAAGVYLIREQVRRTRDELDEPSPATIAYPRTVKVKGENAALWRSEQFTTRRGAAGLVDLCVAELDPTDLHFIAFYTTDNRCLFYVDLLDHDGLAHFDVVDTPDRRRQYESHGRHLRYLAGRIDKRFRDLDSGLLVRFVIDVEKGALFYYSLKREGFLLGVTLDQSQVDPTDRKMSVLANEILVLRGGRPDDDFYRV